MQCLDIIYLCKKVKMNVTGVKQENRSNTFSAIKTGAAGACAAALIGRFAPLTTEEHAEYFSKSATNSIKEKVKNSKISEIEAIKQEFKNGTLNVSGQAFDIFEKNTDSIIQKPKKDVFSIVKDSADDVKEGFKSLTSRVLKAGATTEHIETHTIKNAAKSARSLGYIAAIGALVAMTGQILVNLVKNSTPNENSNTNKNKTETKGDLTMADILLEGLGSNAEILFLTNNK